MQNKKCVRCGAVLKGLARKYCPECAHQVLLERKRRDNARARARAKAQAADAPAEPRPVRYCGRCGVELIDNHGGRKWCRACAEEINRERSRAYYEEHGERIRADQKRKRCAGIFAGDGGQGAVEDDKATGKRQEETERTGRFVNRPYEGTGERIATSPSLLAMTETEIPTVRSTEYWRHVARKCRLTGDQIALLAQEYERPFDSYGKLRAYIDTYDSLPPKCWLKRRLKLRTQDEQARPEDRGGIPQPRTGGTVQDDRGWERCFLGKRIRKDEG